MPTIQIKNDDRISNLTSYLDENQANNDLFTWQYVCSRLFKVSSTVPKDFHFIGDLNKEGLQKTLYQQYEKRNDSKKININEFLTSSEMAPCRMQSVPEIMEKDYLLLDLILTQKVISEQGIEHVSEYGKKLINFVEGLQNKEFKDIPISIDLVNEIIENEKIYIQEHASKVQKVKKDLENMEKQIQWTHDEIRQLEKDKDIIMKDAVYVSSDLPHAPDNIEKKKKHREKIEQSMGLIDKLQLRVLQFMGKNTSHLYNDNLEKLEIALQEEFKSKAQFANNKIEHLNNNITTNEQKISDFDNKITELKTTLRSLKDIDVLQLGINYLDNDYTRDVNRVMKGDNAIFLHSITTDNGFQPYDNSPLKQGVSFSDKVNQIRCFNPSLSCSSFKLDNNSMIDEFTAPMGVILNGGNICSASTCDDGTVPQSNGERIKQNISSKDISNTINSRENSYDEFAIASTKIAGLYINFDRLQRMAEKSYNHQPLITMLENVLSYNKKGDGLPIMIIKDGNIHTISPKYNQGSVLNEFKLQVQDAQNNNKKLDIAKLNEELLNSAFIVSGKKNINEIMEMKHELNDERKLALSENLINNYKPAFQAIIEEKVNNFKSNVSKMREKFTACSKNPTLGM